MKKFISVWTILFVLGLSTLTLADSEIDEVIYCQVVNGQKTVFLVNSDGTNRRTVISGKDVKTYLIRKHILYFIDHQLFEYLPAIQKGKLLKRFDENTISIQDLSNMSDTQSDSRAPAPDQAIILAENLFEQNLYILEFSDGSIRNVTSSVPSGSSVSGGATSLKSNSSDRNALAVIHQDGVRQRFELLIQVKKNGKFKTSWTLPQNMTIIPELPLWSPDSRMLAFYARPYEGVSGFYSLYIYNLELKEMRLIQEQVFSTIPSNSLTMRSFMPEWSKDSKSLIFQYQNYGPTDSLIIKYEVATGKKVTLTASRGHNLNPTWSVSGKSILFLSNRESAIDQVYTMDDNGGDLKRLSPPEGYTEWASWYKAE